MQHAMGSTTQSARIMSTSTVSDMACTSAVVPVTTTVRSGPTRCAVMRARRKSQNSAPRASFSTDHEMTMTPVELSPLTYARLTDASRSAATIV